jgi:hypothetical protein
VPTTTTKPVLAWRCTWQHRPDCVSFAAAETRGRALAILLASITSTRYDAAWPELRAVRAPHLDAWAQGLTPPQRWYCWSEEMVESVSKGKGGVDDDPR